MANMSYCRFQNTYPDLWDCYEHWEDRLEEDEQDEQKARIKLLKLCKTIVENFSEED